MFLSVACVGLRTQDVLPYVSDFCRCMFTRMACVGVSGMGYHVRHEMVRDHADHAEMCLFALVLLWRIW